MTAADHYGAQVKEVPGFLLQSPDQARAWLAELLAGVRQARVACDVAVPGDADSTVRMQLSAERRWLLKHGAALGTIMALFRAGLIDQVAYDEFRGQVMALMSPTIVGVST